MGKTIPEKLIDYTVYKDGSLPLGTATVTLPNLEAMSETIKGAGILGEIDSPTLGHYGSLTVGLDFRTVTNDSLQLMSPGVHTLDFRGSQQIFDIAKSEHMYQGLKVTIRGTTKSFNLGKLEPHATTDTSVELEVNYIKILLDGKTAFELDKYNGVFVTNGVDHYATIRKQLGM